MDTYKEEQAATIGEEIEAREYERQREEGTKYDISLDNLADIVDAIDERKDEDNIPY